MKKSNKRIGLGPKNYLLTLKNSVYKDFLIKVSNNIKNTQKNCYFYLSILLINILIILENYD